MQMQTTYTIDRVTQIDDDLALFLNQEIPKISKRFGDKFNYNYCPIGNIFKKAVILVGRRNGEVRGILVAFLTPSVFDIKTIILQQQIFYVKPDSGRTAYHLFNKFIDIGRHEANHIITMLTSETNIKSETLEKLGFKELETLYRLEV